MEVIYQGIRLTPEQIAAAARDEDVDIVGLSVLSGSHRELVPQVVRLLRAAGVTAPVVVGGIIPEGDQPALLAAGVARVYTPKDFRLTDIIADLADARGHHMNAPDTHARDATAPADDDLRPDSYRGVAVCAVLAVLAVSIGIVAVVADEAVLALAAAVIGVAAAGIGSFLDVRRAHSDRSLLEARAQSRRLRRELQFLQASAAEAQQDDPDLPADLAAGSEEWEIDPVSGLLRERHLPVLLQQVVAAARRKVLPVSVVFWEVDGLEAAPPAARDQAVTALGAVAWRTLRESDALFRIGDVVAVAVLVDTAEPGALTVAERVREQLRSSPIGDALTVSAGIACYPSHALDAAELVSRAGHALDAARASGHTRDFVAIASAE